MITLTLKDAPPGTVPLELSDRLLWTDEYAWNPVVIEARFGTTGAQMVHVGKRKAGQPITLDGKESAAWISRAQCDQFKAWAAIAGAAFDLRLRGVVSTVLFVQFQADPVWQLLDSEHVGEHASELQYMPLFKFLTV